MTRLYSQAPSGCFRKILTYDPWSENDELSFEVTVSEYDPNEYAMSLYPDISEAGAVKLINFGIVRTYATAASRPTKGSWFGGLKITSGVIVLPQESQSEASAVLTYLSLVDWIAVISWSLNFCSEFWHAISPRKANARILFFFIFDWFRVFERCWNQQVEAKNKIPKMLMLGIRP